MFTGHNRFKKKNNKNTYKYYDSGHDSSYYRTDEVNLLTAPSFLSQFKPKYDGKKLRTTSQLEPDTYCDFVAEVCYFHADTVQRYDHRTGKQTVKKATMILTDYTEHEGLPHQNEQGRPIGKASIITTLWDEHYQAAIDRGIRKGDLLCLRNLRTKTDIIRKIELNMNGYRGFGYRQEFPITKLDPSDTEVKELLSRKALYEQHLAMQEEKRTQRYVTPSYQHQPTPKKQESKRRRPRPPSKTPTMRRPHDPNHPLHLPIYPEGYARSPTPSGTRSPSHGIEPYDHPTFKRNPSLPYSSSSEEDEDENELLAPPRPVRIPGCHIGSFASMSATRSPSQDIQPVVDTLSNREFDLFSKEDDGDNEDEQEDNELEPIQELRTPSVFPNATATRSTKSPFQDIQSVVVDIPSARRSIIIIEDDEDEEDKVLPVPLSRRGLSAKETMGTTRSSSQDTRPVVVDIPSTRRSIIIIKDDEDEEDQALLVPLPRRFLDAEPATSTKQSPSQDFRSLFGTPLKCDPTPLEHNPSLPVECESSWGGFSISVAPGFKYLHPPISLINASSTRPTKSVATSRVAVKSERNREASSSTLSSASAQHQLATTLFEVSPTVVLTEKAKKAKRRGLRVIPLRARVVEYEPETLIDFSGPVCSKCEYKHPSKKKPAPWCPSCKRDEEVAFKYDFKLKLMDELGQDYTVKVDETHATALIGIPAGDLVKDCKKLERVTERLARIGVSEVHRDKQIYFDLYVQTRISRPEIRTETVGASLKRTGSPPPSRPAKRHAYDTLAMDESEPSEPPRPRPRPSEEETFRNFSHWLVFTKILGTERDLIEESSGEEAEEEDEYYGCYDYNEKYDSLDPASTW